MMTTPEKPTGIAAASLFAAALSLLTLAASHLLAGYSEAAKTWVHAWGKAWMPGAQGIGPYSGKETLMLVVWIGSWILLHRWLKKREVNLTLAGILFLAAIGVATTLLWPPVTEAVLHLVKPSP